MIEWWPFQLKLYMTYLLSHHENKRQCSVNSFWSPIFGTQGTAQIYELILELLTAFIGNNSTCKTKNTDFEIIHTANSKTCKEILLAAEYAILIRHYNHTAKIRAIYKSTDGHTERLADNQPK